MVNYSYFQHYQQSSLKFSLSMYLESQIGLGIEVEAKMFVKMDHLPGLYLLCFLCNHCQSKKRYELSKETQIP
jgi:hypothetical protein